MEEDIFTDNYSANATEPSTLASTCSDVMLGAVALLILLY